MANDNYTISAPNWNGSINTKFADITAPTTSFSGTDIIVSFAFDDSRAITVGTMATMTYSIFREKRQVRTLGRISPRGMTKGIMTIAGTMIFSVINQHVVNDIRNAVAAMNPNHPIANTNLKRIRMDELPPFDVILTFGNEYGQSAKMVIYGVTVTDEAMTFSIEDMFTENVMSYFARDIDMMRGPFSPDMSLYIQGGTALGGGVAQLPKYGFSVDKLWSNSQTAYQKQIQGLVDKANTKFAANASADNPVDYSKIPVPALGPATGVVTIRLTVMNDTYQKVVPNFPASLLMGATSLSGTTDANGTVTWENIKPGQTVAFGMGPSDGKFVITKPAASIKIPDDSSADGALFSSILYVNQLRWR